MQIKKGQQFKCIKTVIMDDEEDSEAYIQGKTYISDIDGCITNKMGDKHHSWISYGYDLPENYFEPIEPVKSYFGIQELDKSIAKCKMELWQLMQKYDFESTLTAQILIG